MKILYISLISLLLIACNMTPNKTTAITSKTIEALSSQLDSYEKQGWIEDKKEDDYQRKLLFAHDLLTYNQELLDYVHCPDAKDSKECIKVIVKEIENALLEAK